MIADLLPLAILGAVLGLDVVSFPQAMISRPLVAATAVAIPPGVSSGCIAKSAPPTTEADPHSG